MSMGGQRRPKRELKRPATADMYDYDVDEIAECVSCGMTMAPKLMDEHMQKYCRGHSRKLPTGGRKKSRTAAAPTQAPAVGAVVGKANGMETDARGGLDELDQFEEYSSVSASASASATALGAPTTATSSPFINHVLFDSSNKGAGAGVDVSLAQDEPLSQTQTQTEWVKMNPFNPKRLSLIQLPLTRSQAEPLAPGAAWPKGPPVARVPPAFLTERSNLCTTATGARTTTSRSGGLNGRKFTREEDQFIAAGVAQSKRDYDGTIKWTVVAQHVPNRMPKVQC